MTEKSKNKKLICERVEQKQPESMEALIHKMLPCLSIESFKCLSFQSPVHEVSTMLQTRLKCICAPVKLVKRQKLKYTFSSFCFICNTLINSSSHKSLGCQQSSSINGSLVAHAKPTSILVCFLRDGKIYQKIHKHI